jgi:hypothetical protein
MRTKLAGVAHNKVKEIRDTICPKNLVTIERAPELDNDPINEGKPNYCDGLAYRCVCKGVPIGYLGLLRTIRTYKSDATNGSEQDYERWFQWGTSTKAIRTQFKLDLDAHGEEAFPQQGFISQLLYAKRGDKSKKTKDYQKLSALSPEEQEEWYIMQISVEFPVETF